MAAGDLENQKPQCGGGNNVTDDYDVTLHTLGLFVVLAASCLGAGFPVVAKKVSWVRVPEKVFFACKHFGTGVLIATAFVHLVPTAFDSLGDPCLPDLFTDLYTPMPGVIMMGSLFVLFVIEMWLNSKTGGHSHGGPTGCPTAPAVHQFDSRSTLHLPESQTNDGAGNRNSQYVERLDEKEAESDSEGHGTVTVYEVSSDNESQPEVDPAVYRKMAANIALLEGGILFHSVFVGMTVSITVDGYIILLIAIIFHQMFEGLGLGSRIAAVPYPKGSLRPWFLVFAFGTTAPIGQAIGLAARNTYDPNSAFGLIIVGVFNAISSGLLIYAALVDLLAEDFLSEEARRVMTTKKKVYAFCWVLAGAIGMSIVGAFA